MDITTYTRLERLDANNARILVDTIVDGTTYTNVHVSGPRKLVEEYFHGDVTFKEFQERVFKR